MELVRTLEITTLAALHDLNLAAAYCDRIYVLSAGRIVASGPPEAVLQPDLISEVFGVRADPHRHPATGRLMLAFSPEHRSTASADRTEVAFVHEDNSASRPNHWQGAGESWAPESSS